MLSMFSLEMFRGNLELTNEMSSFSFVVASM